MKSEVAAEKKPAQSQFKTKAKALWADNRRYHKRLLISLAVSFSLCFTFLFFGPIEITASSMSSLYFSAKTITPIMTILSLVVFVVLSLFISILKGKIFNYTATGVFSFTLCAYVQGNFLNSNIGTLNGEPIAWQDQKKTLLINLIIWFVIFITPFILLYFNKKVWKKALLFVSIALVAMQSVALITLVTGGTFTASKEKELYLTKDDMFTYSKEKNTLVFLLDRLDYDYIEEVLKYDPEFFDMLDGFTSYTNAISELARTKPAANYMLTNCDDLLYRDKDYFNKSWNYSGNNILKDLNEKDYTVDIYSEIGNMLGSAIDTKDYVSNLSEKSKNISRFGVAESLIYLSAYRYFPNAIKPFFWCYTDDVNKAAYPNSNIYQIDETVYLKNLDKMSAKDKNGHFKYYHFNGSHPPYRLNEDGSVDLNGTSSLEQTKGSFYILFKAFERMKELDIYDDATIIITADHGSAISDSKPVQKATRIGFFYKPAGSANTPLKYSKAPVSFKNIPATIAKSAGLDYKKYGKPIDEVLEDEVITRKFYKSIMGEKGEEIVYVYDIVGDASDFNNWKVISHFTVEHPYY